MFDRLRRLKSPFPTREKSASNVMAQSDLTVSQTKDLTKCSATQLQKFLTSFDVVMSDIDGVVWQIDHPIKNAFESLAALQKMGKQIYLVTNNSTKDTSAFSKLACHASLDLSPDHVINTSKTIIWYLKKINFQGEAFAIVSDVFREQLQEAGIRLIENPKVHADALATVKEVLDRPSVKAIIVDLDVTANWMKLALAVSCLERKDVLYIAGATEDWIHVKSSPKVKILGAGSYINIISAQSGRKPILCGKPSAVLKDYIFDKYKVTDPQRCLFIGDSANHDMQFASMCGFTKLFVGTGMDTLEKAQKQDDSYPDYYLPSLGQLFSAVEDVQSLCTATKD